MPTADTADHHYMGLALDACRAGIDAGQSPFGACIVRGDAVIAVTHNHVWADTDPSAHAEIVCIRHACRTVGDVHLPAATIYTTTEPCPMCFACIHWTRIERIVFGARVADAASFGFNELPIDNATMHQLAGSTLTITPDCRRDDALALYHHWQQRGGRAY